jgi:hypothetical protein
MLLPPSFSASLSGVLGDHGSSVRLRKSPCPLVCEIIAPEGQMRGPLTTPPSMAFFRLKLGPAHAGKAAQQRVLRLLARQQIEAGGIGIEGHGQRHRGVHRMPVGID